jgi:hypothetical protein
MKLLIHLVCLIVVYGDVEALSLVAITDPMRIEKAERIVIGTLSKNGDQSIITVTQSLKGPKQPDVISTQHRPRGKPSNQVLYANGPYNRPTLIFIEPDSPTWHLYQMLIDPAPILDLGKHPESIDIIQVLGYLFDPVNIASSDAPRVANRLQYPCYKEKLPWGYHGSMDLLCRADPERWARLEILSINPDNKQTERFRLPVISNGMEEADRDKLPESFRLRITTTPPTKRGTLSYHSAISYLRQRLNSPDSSIQCAAVHALARVRDLEAVPTVIRLIDHEDDELAQAALDLLSKAADSRALPALCQLLETHAPVYPDNYQFSNGASRALGSIGSVEAASFLERAVEHGVENAYYALSRCGRASSIHVILNTSTEKGLPNRAGIALYWLVQRSNMAVQPWMHFQLLKGRPMPADKARQWIAWWDKNQNTFKLVRSVEEAALIWHPPVPLARPQQPLLQRAMREVKTHPMEYLIGITAFATLIVAFFLMKRRLRM